jgi:predicted outer membrane repeat protein
MSALCVVVAVLLSSAEPVVADELDEEVTQILFDGTETILLSGADWTTEKVEIRPKVKDDFRAEGLAAARAEKSDAHLGSFDNEGDFEDCFELWSNSVPDACYDEWAESSFDEFFDAWFEENNEDFEEVERGEVAFLGPLVVAPGTTVEVAANIYLHFLANSSLTANGTVEEPIIFKGRDWGGITFDAGALSSQMSQCEVRDSSGNNNQAALRLIGFSRLVVDSCTFSGNQAFRGGSVYLDRASPVIRQSLFSNNNDSFRGGGLFMVNGSNPFLDDNVFENTEDVFEGAAIYMDGSSPVFRRNRFTGNKAQNGGAIFITGLSRPRFSFDLFSNNEATDGGGALYMEGNVTVTMDNVSLAYNLADQGPGLFFTGNAGIAMVNSVIHSNEVRDSDSLSQIHAGEAGVGSFRFSNIQGGREAFTGVGAGFLANTYDNNLDQDPEFRFPANEAGAEGATDTLAVSADSPVINAGEPQSSGSGDTDITGASVPFNGFRIDMGAHEFLNNPPFVGSDSSVTENLRLTLPRTDEDTPVELELCRQSGDRDGHEVRLVVESLPEFGELVVAGNETAGRSLEPGDDVEDGVVRYQPENRRQTYTEAFSCRVRDLIFDEEGEEITELSMLSPNRLDLTIEVVAANDPPDFDSEVPRTLSVNEGLDLEIQVTDPDLEDSGMPGADTSLLTVTAKSIPPWMTLQDDGEGGVRLTGTAPPEAEGETVEVTLTVTDVFGAATDRTYEIRITPQKQLEVAIDRAPSGAPGELIRLSASGDEGGSVTYEWTISNDAGVEVETGLGPSVSFVPETEGVFLAEVIIRDDEGSLTDRDEAEFAIAAGFGRVEDRARQEPDADEEQEIEARDTSTGASSGPQEARAFLVTLASSADENRAEAETLARLARLRLDMRQRGILLSALESLINEGALERGTLNHVLGALDNLVVRDIAFDALTVEQFESLAGAVSTPRMDYDKSQILKAFNILDGLALQQGGDNLPGRQAGVLDRLVKDLIVPAAGLDTRLVATGGRYLRLRMEPIAFPADGNFQAFELGSGAASSSVRLPPAFLRSAAQQWGGAGMTLAVLDNAVAAQEIPDVTAVRFLSEDNVIRSPENLGVAFTLGLPLRDETMLSPRHFNETLARWVGSGLQPLAGSEGESPIRFSTRKDGDFALLASSDNGDSGSSVETAPVDTAEELSSCLFDGL